MPLIMPESPENLSSGIRSLKEQVKYTRGEKREKLLQTSINSMYKGKATQMTI